jgi:hypothetical protein
VRQAPRCAAAAAWTTALSAETPVSISYHANVNSNATASVTTVSTTDWEDNSILMIECSGDLRNASQSRERAASGQSICFALTCEWN